MNSLSRRAFSSLYNYSNAANPRVWLSVANNGDKIGDMVFELYSDRQPAHAEHFKVMLSGNAEGKSYVGQSFQRGMPGLGVIAGRMEPENFGAFGVWNPDGDLSMRHHKRGMLTATNDGPGHNGSEFMITFNEAQYLNGSQTVFGELVEGESVLAEIEKHVDRHGKIADGITISAAGEK